VKCENGWPLPSRNNQKRQCRRQSSESENIAQKRALLASGGAKGINQYLARLYNNCGNGSRGAGGYLRLYISYRG